MNDVLSKWRPSLDLSLFNQGPLTNGFWDKFLEFVELCHATCYFSDQKKEYTRHSKNLSLKTREVQEYLKSAERAETLSFRAKLFAKDLCFEMDSAASNETESALINRIFTDSGLSRVNTLTCHQTANFSSFKVNEFSFNAFLN